MSVATFDHYVILGHSGFVGQRLEQRLRERGASVQGFSSKGANLAQFDAVSSLSAAVTPRTALIVLAGVTPDRGVNLETLSANMAIGINLGRLLGGHPPAVCLFFSSDAVYPMVDAPVTEDTPVEFGNYYALAKYASEYVLQQVAKEQGFPLVIVRATGIYGFGDTHRSYGPNRFVDALVRTGKVSIFGRGEEQRDHLYVDDAVSLTIALAERGTSDLLNLASGSCRTFGSIVGDLRRIAAVDFKVDEHPRGGEITHRQYDVTRLRRAVPDFAFTPFETGLRSMYNATVAAFSAGSSPTSL